MTKLSRPDPLPSPPDITPRLKIGTVQAASAQKHVTVNEALQTLDALVNLTALDVDINAPFTSAFTTDGDVYLVGSDPSGVWEGQAFKIAYYRQGWYFYEPQQGYKIFVSRRGSEYIYAGDSIGWKEINPKFSQRVRIEGGRETISDGQQTYIITSERFPARSIVLGVTVRVERLNTGNSFTATSFNCGRSIGGDEYGGLLSLDDGFENIGVVAPFPIYASEPVYITSNGGTFALDPTEINFNVVLNYISLA